jgi:hypothetical protein
LGGGRIKLQRDLNIFYEEKANLTRFNAILTSVTIMPSFTILAMAATVETWLQAPPQTI